MKDLGLVLSGSVTIERDDLLGNRSILAIPEQDRSLRKTYACVPEEPLMVNVVADEDTDILFSGHWPGADHLPDHLHPPQHADQNLLLASTPAES